MNISFEGSARSAKRPHLSDSEDDDEQYNRNTAGLAWRMDPQQSLSDWTIEICSSCGLSATYHVHKSFLAVGRAKCDYFAVLFQKGDDTGHHFAEFTDCTSRFKFDQKAANAFPSFLDFVYGCDCHSPSAKSKYITTENAVAMYYLAEYLGCQHLRRSTRRFFEHNLIWCNVLTFYVDSKQFRNEKFINEIARYCAMNIELFDTKIAEVSDHLFWLEVVRNYQPSLDQSRQLSRLLSTFCCNNIKKLDLETFTTLTHENKLTQIHHDEAILLMLIEDALWTLSNRKAHKPTKTSLQSRCEAALVGHWHHIDLDRLTPALQSMHSTLFVHLLKLSQEEIKRFTTNGDDDNSDASSYL